MGTTPEQDKRIAVEMERLTLEKASEKYPMGKRYFIKPGNYFSEGLNGEPVVVTEYRIERKTIPTNGDRIGRMTVLIVMKNGSEEASYSESYRFDVINQKPVMYDQERELEKLGLTSKGLGESYGSFKSTFIEEDPFKKFRNKPALVKKFNKGMVWIGMTEEELLASRGEPRSINQTTTAAGTSKQWVYGGNIYFYTENGRLRSVQN